MPFSYDLLDQEQQKKKDQDQGDTQGAPAMTGGGSTFGGSGGAAPAGQPAQKGTSQQGSGFVNLDKYMAANQGNNFGNQVTGKVQGDVDQAKNTLGSSAADFTDASNKGATNWGDVGDTVKGYVDNAGDKTSADDAANFQKYSNAKYQGPESFSGSAYGTAAQGANIKASQEAGALQNEGGRFALLDQFYGRPNYSTGEKSLDNLLVQNQPGVAARASSIGNQAKQLTATADQTGQQLDNLAAANKSATQDTASQAKNYLNTATSGFSDQLNSELAAKKQTDADQYQQMFQRLQDNSLSSDDLASLGVGGDEKIYNLDPSKYLSQGQDPTIYNTASADEYARAKALAQLAGEDDSSILSSSTADQAGTAGPAYQFDTSELRSDQAAGEAQMQKYNQQSQALAVQMVNLQAQLAAAWNDSGKQQEIKSQIDQTKTAQEQLQQLYQPDRILGASTGRTPLGGNKMRPGI